MTQKLGELREWASDTIGRAFAGSIVYPPRGTHGPRRQNDVQLVTLHSGSLELHVDEHTLHIIPGSVLLLLPGHREHFFFSRTEDSWHRWITLSPIGNLPSGVVEALRRLPPVLPLSESMNKVIDVAVDVYQASANTHDLLKVLGLSALHLYEAETIIDAERQQVHRAVSITKYEIAHRYMEPLTIPILAAISNVSQEHLIRLFRQYEGTTPGSYLWKIRVNKSMDLLRNTGLSIGEIAERTGFKNSHHFSRLFKRSTGNTPSEYRGG